MDDKAKLIEEIVSVLEKADDENVLQDMKNLINGVYKHYVSGKWEC